MSSVYLITIKSVVANLRVFIARLVYVVATIATCLIISLMIVDFLH